MHRHRVLAAIGVHWQIHCFDLHEIKATRPQFGVNSLGISLPKNVQNQTQTHTGINEASALMEKAVMTATKIFQKFSICSVAPNFMDSQGTRRSWRCSPQRERSCMDTYSDRISLFSLHVVGSQPSYLCSSLLATTKNGQDHLQETKKNMPFLSTSS